MPANNAFSLAYSLFIGRRPFPFFFPLYSITMASATPIQPGRRSLAFLVNCLIEMAPSFDLKESSSSESP